MSTFTATADWSLQGCVDSRVSFTSDAGAVTDASVSAGVLSVDLPAITGWYRVRFDNTSVWSTSCAVSGFIAPFRFYSGAAGSTVDLLAVCPQASLSSWSIYQ